MEAATAALSAQDVTTLNKILAAVEEEINICDPKHNLGLSHFNDILSGVLEKVYAHMGSEQRSELNEGDLALIQQLVRRQVTEQLASVLLPKLRFEISDRVVCLIGGDRPWAAGKVQALHEPDPSDPTGQVRFPYVVKIDPPNGRLVSVPRDSHDVVRPEVCFGLTLTRTASRNTKPNPNPKPTLSLTLTLTLTLTLSLTRCASASGRARSSSLACAGLVRVRVRVRVGARVRVRFRARVRVRVIGLGLGLGLALLRAHVQVWLA